MLHAWSRIACEKTVSHKPRRHAKVIFPENDRPRMFVALSN